MEYINYIDKKSPEYRDTLLNKNIGKYDMITRYLDFPIGDYFKIYDEINDKLEKKFNGDKPGLVEYTNKINNSGGYVEGQGELSEDVFMSIAGIRGDNLIQFTDGDVLSKKPQKYTGLEGDGYNDPDDDNWIDKAIDIGSSLFQEETLDYETSLIGNLSSAFLNASDISKKGLKYLISQFGYDYASKKRIDWFNQPLNWGESIDRLEFEFLNNSKIPSWIRKFSAEIIPIYFYSDIKDETTSRVISRSDDINARKISDYYWDGKGEFISESNQSIGITAVTKTQQSLLYKTSSLFKRGKIETMVNSFQKTISEGDKSVSSDMPLAKGRGIFNSSGDPYRSWGTNKNYGDLSSLIRPFSNQNKANLNNWLKDVRPGSKSLQENSVLDTETGFVNISPYNDFGESKDVKKYMFSIENLAWKDSIDSIIRGTSQEGPNGGRIMWFPPYEIKFNDNTSVNWNSEVFIGRGEPVYTYSNTERSGNISFKLVVDHPSIINYYNRDGNYQINESDYLNFFAGGDVVGIPDQSIFTGVTQPQQQTIKDDTNYESRSFKVYFPNNYSGVNNTYEEVLEYLTQGKNCQIYGGNGYEQLTGEYMGLTSSDIESPCLVNFYYKVDDNSEVLNNSGNYKDSMSFGLNREKHENIDTAFSFYEVYNGNVIDDFIKDADQIRITSTASDVGNKVNNNDLAKNRGAVIRKWLESKNHKAEYIQKEEIITVENNTYVNSRKSKEARYVLVEILKKYESISYAGSETNTQENNASQQNANENKNSSFKRVKVPMYGYHNKENETLKNDESKFFQRITNGSIGEIITGEMQKKIKYFHPAFHSTTPEGFNARLTFLHQCTRQGPTINETGSATNMAFGRPPVCVLRIGDFYHTKVIFDNLQIDYEPLVWDLNEEGIGVQPMIANINLSFKFIGGSDLTGPIARLQNAITFNFFANTGVYDDRNDRITKKGEDGKDTYYELYNPKIYDDDK